MPRGQDGVAAGSLETGDTRHVGTRASYTCPPGYRLQGDREIVCRDDGGSRPHVLHALLCITNVSAATWSGTGTTCSPVQCPPLEIVSPHVRVLGLNNSFAGTASFDCPFGYRLTGKQSIVCQGAA